MKKFAWIGLLMIAGLLFTKGLGRAEDVKVGIVDVSKIFSVYTKVAENRVEFDKFVEERRADVQKKIEAADKQIKVLQDKIDKQGKAMKKEASDKITADIEAKNQEKYNLQLEYSQDLKTKNLTLVDARVKEIETAITNLAKEKGYTLVINKEVVYYFPEAADLSDQIIAILNKPAAVTK